MYDNCLDREAALVHQQAILARFGELVVKSSSLDEILHEACRLVGSALGTDLAKVMELQSDSSTLLVRAGVGWKPGIVGHETVQAHKGSSEGHAIQTGKPVTSENIETETRFTYAHFLKDHGVRAFVNVIIPGVGSEGPYGILQVDSREPRGFTDGDTQFLRGYANLIAASVFRFRMHDEQQRAEAKLRQSQKMEAVGQLTGGIAHDFNNMLAGIIGSLEILQMRVQQKRYAELDRYASAAMNSASKAAVLTSRLLSFSRQQTLEPRRVQPDQLIKDFEELIRRTVGPGISMRTVLAPAVGSIMTDTVQLENAVLNLIINARDAMPSGGALTVSLSEVELADDAATRHDLPEGRYVKLSVQDTGMGMLPEVIERACDPFYTTKPQGQGTGLGLSMVYGFAKQSGGTVQIDSRRGEGTVVSIYLPSHQPVEPTLVQEHDDQRTLPRARHAELILLVEDDSVVRLTIHTLLHDLGYEVLEAFDAQSCFTHEDRFSEVTLLISDVGLPGESDGFELVDAVRERRPDMPALLVTGFAKAKAMGQTPLDRGVHIMTKPFSVHALAMRVREVIDEEL